MIPYNDLLEVDNKVSDVMDVSGNVGRPASARYVDKLRTCPKIFEFDLISFFPSSSQSQGQEAFEVLTEEAVNDLLWNQLDSKVSFFAWENVSKSSDLIYENVINDFPPSKYTQ